MKTIVITGSGGLIGSYLSSYFSNNGFRVIHVCRAKDRITKDDYILWDYYQSLFPSHYSFERDISIDYIVHCGYDFSDKSLINNSNLQAVKLLTAYFDRSVFINISTMSAFTKCVSAYGKVKLMIEGQVNKVNGYNLRLGIPISNPPMGFHQLVLKIYQWTGLLVPSITSNNAGLMFETNMDAFCSQIEEIMMNKSKAPGTYSVVNPVGLTMASFINKYTKAIVVPINWRLIYYVFKGFEFIGIKFRFGSDSVLSIANSISDPEFNILNK